MTAAQTIQIKLSSCRQRLNELLQVEERSAEEQTEMETLTNEVSAREPELRAALAAEDDKQEVVTTADAETRELAAVDREHRHRGRHHSRRRLRSARPVRRSGRTSKALRPGLVTKYRSRNAEDQSGSRRAGRCHCSGINREMPHKPQ